MSAFASATCGLKCGGGLASCKAAAPARVLPTASLTPAHAQKVRTPSQPCTGSCASSLECRPPSGQCRTSASGDSEQLPAQDRGQSAGQFFEQNPSHFLGRNSERSEPAQDGFDSGKEMEVLFPPSTGFPGSSSMPDVPRLPPNEVNLLACLQTEFSAITILEFPEDSSTDSFLSGSRVMLLDSSSNVSSAFFKGRLSTNSYWDELAAAVAISPTSSGPVGILGLAGGTVAQLIRQLWPTVHVEGWEIDGVVIDMAREYFELAELETPSPEGGVLTVHVGDAFDALSSSPAGFSLLIVDLFHEGRVLKQLGDPQVWESLKGKLVEGGRVIVNCGGPSLEPELGSQDESLGAVKAVLSAMSQVFGASVYFKVTAGSEANYLATAGSTVDCERWQDLLPGPLADAAEGWNPLDKTLTL